MNCASSLIGKVGKLSPIIPGNTVIVYCLPLSQYVTIHKASSTCHPTSYSHVVQSLLYKNTLIPLVLVFVAIPEATMFIDSIVTSCLAHVLIATCVQTIVCRCVCIHSLSSLASSLAHCVCALRE